MYKKYRNKVILLFSCIHIHFQFHEMNLNVWHFSMYSWNKCHISGDFKWLLCLLLWTGSFLINLMHIIKLSGKNHCIYWYMTHGMSGFWLHFVLNTKKSETQKWCFCMIDIYLIWNWRLLFFLGTFVWGRNILCKLLEQQVSDSSNIYTWFRTNCCFPTNGTFGFPWSARLGMPGACCGFLMFLSVCTLQFFLLDGASSMQMICNIFKVFVFLPVVFCGLGFWFCWMTFISALFSVLVVILTIQFPRKLYLYFCVLDTVEDESVMVFEAPVELNSQSAITVTSFWFE